MVVVNWLMEHSAVLAGLAVAVLDFIVELVPALKGNGIVSLIVGLLKKPKAPAA